MVEEEDLYAQYAKEVNDANDSDDDSDAEDIPYTHQFGMPGSKKPINCLRFNHSGTHLVSSSMDHSLSIFDFNSLNAKSESPSVSMEPFETNYIGSLEINKKDQILALPNESFFKILDLKGEEVQHFSSGDKFIYDVKKTFGHTDLITSGDWNENSNTFITSSFDSTFRIWDLSKSKQINVNFIKHEGKKIKVNKAKYINKFKNVISMDNKERILNWDLNSNFQRPINEINSDSKPISILSIDEHQFLIKSIDNLKIFDLRNLSNPVIQRLNFNSVNENIILNNNFILSELNDEIHVLDKSDLVTIKKINMNSKINSFDWNDSTNQISIGDSKGKISILFNPNKSTNGIMKTIKNKPISKKYNSDIYVGRQTGYNLDELEELNRSRKKKKYNPTTESS